MLTFTFTLTQSSRLQYLGLGYCYCVSLYILFLIHVSICTFSRCGLSAWIKVLIDWLIDWSVRTTFWRCRLCEVDWRTDVDTDAQSSPSTAQRWRLCHRRRATACNSAQSRQDALSRLLLQTLPVNLLDSWQNYHADRVCRNAQLIMALSTSIWKGRQGNYSMDRNADTPWNVWMTGLGSISTSADKVLTLVGITRSSTQRSLRGYDTPMQRVRLPPARRVARYLHTQRRTPKIKKEDKALQRRTKKTSL